MIAVTTQCFQPDVGGVEALMTGLADALATAGEKPVVFADRIRGGRGELARPYAVTRFGGPRPWRAFAKRRALARTSGIRGIFCDSWKSVDAVPDGLGPIVALAHGTEFPEQMDERKTRRMRAALGRCRALVAVSQYTAGLAAKACSGLPVDIHVVNPPIPQLPEPTAEALAAIDARLAGRGPVITSLARLEERKGIDAVLHALPALRARHPGLVYLVAGGGDDRGRLEALTAELRLADAVIFLGAVTDPAAKAALLTRTDVFTMPSRRVGASVEGFGIVYVEAGWYGAPSIAGNDGGSADAIIDGRTGLLCDGADDGDVLDVLSRLLDDEGLRKVMGAAAAHFSRRHFTWDAALPKYLAAMGL